MRYFDAKAVQVRTMKDIKNISRIPYQVAVTVGVLTLLF